MQLVEKHFIFYPWFPSCLIAGTPLDFLKERKGWVEICVHHYQWHYLTPIVVTICHKCDAGLCSTSTCNYLLVQSPVWMLTIEKYELVGILQVFMRVDCYRSIIFSWARACAGHVRHRLHSVPRHAQCEGLDPIFLNLTIMPSQIFNIVILCKHMNDSQSKQLFSVNFDELARI